MLRTVRSLPSLRLLYQQEAATLKGQVQAKSTYSYTCGELFQPSTTAIRNVHQTAKKETILLDSSSEKSRYTTMNLQGLKMECKKRGLKVSGRKLDLVQRLVSQDQLGAENSRSFTNISSNNANTLNSSNPKFSLLDKQIKESKIAEAIRYQKKHELSASHKNLNDSKEVKNNLLKNSSLTNSGIQSIKLSAETGKTRVQDGKTSEKSKYKEDRKLAYNKLSSCKTNERKGAQLKLQAQKRDAEKKAFELRVQADRRAAELKLQREREAQELKLQGERRATEKKAAEMKLQREREAHELKLQAEKRAAEKKVAEMKLEREREAQELKLQTERRATEKKAAELQMQKEAEELKLREASKKADLQTREKIATITETIKHSIIKQSAISQILSKAHEQSKVDVVASAKRQLQERAKLVQLKEQQQQQQQHQQQHKEQRKEQNNNLNSRDVKFLTAFGLSTIGWWSLKESSI